MSHASGSTSASRGMVSHTRNEYLTVPNAVTLVRAALTGCLFVWPENVMLAFWFSFIVAVGDLIDGYLAKTLDQCTAFGKRFDQYVDWFFGVALLYALYLHEGFTRHSIPPAILIGGYLCLRLLVPYADTNKAARIKTGMQFTAGVTLLGSYAYESTIAWYCAYGIVWASIGFMFYGGKQYFDFWRSRT